MQKLVWQNANGDILDLTKTPYGITNWEGFANTSLNIQSQQVPFQDGGVFLDALMEQRELSVTLAIYDGNDLEKRYQYRRELIHTLNPKLGEGYLIYTNDFISKRIKCVAQIPLFETHNSNDSGTPKASLAWTACEPYWEDVEETVVNLKTGARISVENNGDIPCNIKLDLFTTYAKNPQILNFKNNKKIKLNGEINQNVLINTNLGEKNIKAELYNFNIENVSCRFRDICYSEELGMFVAVYNTEVIILSKDGYNWNVANKANANYSALYGVVYSSELHLFVAVGEKILTSADGITWANRTAQGTESLQKVFYIDFLHIFIAVGDNGTIKTSADGITWTSRTSGVNVTLLSCFSSNNLVVVVGNNGTILTSADGITWTSRTSGTTEPISCGVYAKSKYYALSFYTCFISTDGITWTPYDYEDYNTNLQTLVAKQIIYLSSQNIFYVLDYQGIRTSDNGIVWSELSFIDYSESFAYSVALGLFVVIASTGIAGVGNIYTYNGTDIIRETNSLVIQNLAYSKSLKLFVGLGDEVNVSRRKRIFTSNDSRNWNSTDYLNPNDNLAKVIYSENEKKFIIVGEFYDSTLHYNIPVYYVSSDGIKWERTVINIEYSTRVHDICYSEKLNLFVMVGYYYDSHDTYGIIFTSSDLINWSRFVTANPVTNSFSVVVYGENANLFIASNGIDCSYLSSDGVLWTEKPYAVSNICYSNFHNIFVNGSTQGAISISSDGVNWDLTYIDTQYNITSIIYNEECNLFIAGTDGGEIFLSSDAINWIKSFTALSRIGTICYCNHLNKFIVLDGYGDILGSFITYNNESFISHLSSDSDMNFTLEISKNDILFNLQEGNASAVLSYRQKYIGV